ncbi:DciA family protein [Brunnivagina elsteri]|uniref:RNA-binding protein n=1 Tax=Brunnivagina elsteri CCALA 953 TaxID=987040 RepID=A0A2A2TI56_9CYAN|nr:DciA family protein [Calothrix elsteri]PAX53366.1 RNA-binding protein [Calothrix elsteri CCALA 953]
MSLKSVNDVLTILKAKAVIQEPPVNALLRDWHEIVGDVLALQTRPLSIQRHLLRVATSSAAWAQNLTFERQSLLIKVNQRLAIPVVNIHFSTAGWHISPIREKKPELASQTQHPSYLGESINIISAIATDVSEVGLDKTTTRKKAFDAWASAVKVRSHKLPLCPQCQCPTPPGELQRWDVCALCAAKRF